MLAAANNERSTFFCCAATVVGQPRDGAPAVATCYDVIRLDVMTQSPNCEASWSSLRKMLAKGFCCVHHPLINAMESEYRTLCDSELHDTTLIIWTAIETRMERAQHTNSMYIASVSRTQNNSSKPSLTSHDTSSTDLLYYSVLLKRVSYASYHNHTSTHHTHDRIGGGTLCMVYQCRSVGVVDSLDIIIAVWSWFECRPEGDFLLWETTCVFVDCVFKSKRYRAESALA